jgi:hypothetical protein
MIKMKTILLITIVCLFASCKSIKNKDVEQNTDMTEKNEILPEYKAGPQTVVYKTKNDYYYNVPVNLNDDKTEIVFYPTPSDVFYNGKLSYPYKLADDYLLDNRGINENVAFLEYTYEEYIKLRQVPDIDSLFTKIIDDNPLTEIYNCGNRYVFKDEINDLNKLIENDGLSKCKCLN